MMRRRLELSGETAKPPRDITIPVLIAVVAGIVVILIVAWQAGWLDSILPPQNTDRRVRQGDAVEVQYVMTLAGYSEPALDGVISFQHIGLGNEGPADYPPGLLNELYDKPIGYERVFSIPAEDGWPKGDFKNMTATWSIKILSIGDGEPVT